MILFHALLLLVGTVQGDLLPPTSSPNAQSSLTTVSLPQNLTTESLTAVACYNPSLYLSSVFESHCDRIISLFLTRPDILDPIVWDPHTALPAKMVHGSCSVVFTRTRPGATAMFEPALIAHAAALIIRDCVTKDFNWQGGQARLEEGRFMVYVSADVRDVGKEAEGNETVELTQIGGSEVKYS